MRSNKLKLLHTAYTVSLILLKFPALYLDIACELTSNPPALVQPNKTHVAMTHEDHTLQRLIQLFSKLHVITYRCHEGRGSKGEGSCAQEETGDGPDFVHRVRLDVKIHFPARQAKATGGPCSGSHLRPFTCMKRSSRPPPAAGHVHKSSLTSVPLGRR